jgi:hypothetical protein
MAGHSIKAPLAIKNMVSVSEGNRASLKEMSPCLKKLQPGMLTVEINLTLKTIVNHFKLTHQTHNFTISARLT